jgi:DNA-binding response OmpR family regulator
MSGYTDEISGFAADEGADSAFLRKPFEPEELGAKVRAVLGASQ